MLYNKASITPGLSSVACPPAGRHKIAIIGAGISGLGAAYDLSHHHDVTIFEARKRFGGHARTWL